MERASLLKLKIQTAMGLLVEEKWRKRTIAVVEVKKFEPRNNLEKLEDYGGSPSEDFWQYLENATISTDNNFLRT